MSLGEAFDETLRAARAAAEAAWAALYRDLAPALLGYLRAGGADDPEDLLGEVFVHVVRDLPRFRGGERDFRAWVFTIAHRRLVDAARSRARRPVQPAPDDLLEARGPAGDPEERALASAEADRLLRLVATLSADQREVLLLRLFSDLPVAEVATILGKRPGSVKALQRRGIAALRRALVREGVSR